MVALGVPVPALSASFEDDLVAGFAVLLEQSELGVWRPDGGPVAADETLITQATVPGNSDQYLSLTPYGIADAPVGTMSTYGLQIRSRWPGADPRGVNRLGSGVFDALHQRGGFTLSTGITVYTVKRTSWTSLGQDGAKRWSRSDNYAVECARPTRNRY